MVDLRRAFAIHGWMTKNELYWLATQAGNKTTIAEIGCWHGRTTRALADNSSAVIFAIDTWEGSAENEHREILRSKPNGWLLDQFTENLRDHAGHIFPITRRSFEAAYHFRKLGIKFDMIFIDAAHDSFSFSLDLYAWYPLLSRGGLFCGHDYSPEYPGIVDLVKQKFGSGFKVVERIWFVGAEVQ